MRACQRRSYFTKILNERRQIMELDSKNAIDNSLELQKPEDEPDGEESEKSSIDTLREKDEAYIDKRLKSYVSDAI